jgi:5-methylcytosine-specific restriction endonuclease McrA
MQKKNNRAGRPRIDHERVPCTKCGGKRDRGCSTCKSCAAKAKRDIRKKDPEKYRKALREWYAKNPEKVKMYAIKNYQKHKERFKESAKKWGKANPEKRSKIMVFQNAKRRSRIKENGGNGFTKKEWDKMLKLCNNTCVYCMKEKANSIDHFVPLSLGGKHDISNICPACRMCNSIKTNQDPKKWVIENCGIERYDAIVGMLKDFQ